MTGTPFNSAKTCRTDLQHWGQTTYKPRYSLNLTTVPTRKRHRVHSNDMGFSQVLRRIFQLNHILLPLIPLPHTIIPLGPEIHRPTELALHLIDLQLLSAMGWQGFQTHPLIQGISWETGGYARVRKLLREKCVTEAADEMKGLAHESLKEKVERGLGFSDMLFDMWLTLYELYDADTQTHSYKYSFSRTFALTSRSWYTTNLDPTIHFTNF